MVIVLVIYINNRILIVIQRELWIFKNDLMRFMIIYGDWIAF